METIALFGGSFDPPHVGHVAVVQALLDFKDVEKVVVMPTFINPFKQKSHASAELRIQWLKKIFSSYKNVEISDFEVNRKEKVSTIISVKHLLNSYKKIYLVIGADNLSSLHKWDRFEELKKLVTFVVASRNKIDIPKNFLKLKVDENISSSSLRKQMEISKLPKECAVEISEYYKEKNEK